MTKETRNNCRRNQESEEKFQAIFENNSTAIIIIEADTTISMVNNAYCEISGYTKDEIIGKSWMDQIPPQDIDRLKEYNRRRLANDKDVPNKYECTLYKKNGEIRHGMLSVSMLESSKKLIVSFLDITERKQAEESLRMSEERFRSFVECANDIVFAITPDGIFTYASPNWTERLGHHIDEIIGHSIAEFVHPDYLIGLSILIKQNFETGEKLNGVEYRIKNKDGQWLWHSSSSSPIIDANGKVSALIGIAHDITQRKLTEEALSKSEALLNTLIQTIPDLIWLKSPEGVYLSCNSMFERFFGFPQSEIVGKTDYDFVNRQLADSFRKNDQIAIEKGSPSNNEEWVTFADDGHRAILDTLKTPMFDSTGKLIGVLGIARDITKQKMAQQALDEKEAQYRQNLENELIERKKSQLKLETANTLLTAVLESSPDVIIFALDKDYRYLTFNNKHKEIMLNIWGKEISPGMNMLEDVIGTPNDRQNAKTNFDRVLAGENLILVEEYGDEALTRQFWQNIYSPIHSANGEIIGLTCYVLDISELKRTEEALKESEYFFKESQRAAFIGSYKTNFVSAVWESSEILDQIFGIDKDYQRSVNEGWLNIIHPDDRDFMKQYLMEEVIMKHKPFNAEYRIVRKSDGETRWVNGLGKVDFDANGNVASLIGTIQDITTRKLAEKVIIDSQSKLSLALKIAHLGAWEYDIANDLFTFNDEFYAIYRTDASKVGGYQMTAAEYVKRFVYPDDVDIVRNEIREISEMGNQNQIRQLEHRIIYADGNIGHIAVCLAVIIDKNGNTIRNYGINQDITERKHAEEILKKSEAQLRELNATKDKFFSIIAHDLRNPFASLLGFLEIMATKNSKLTINQYLQFSQLLFKSTESTYHLLENLLEWSRVQRGSIPFAPKQINVKDIIYEIDESVVEMARKKTIDLKFDLPEGLVVYADQNMLLSIIRNLITNATKFTEPGGSIKVKALLTDDESILFSIKDTGIGMSNKLINNLFQVDSNINRQGTNGEPSTGLGLILCKEFVEKHGGKIWAESEEGKGSTFNFTIPKNA